MESNARSIRDLPVDVLEHHVFRLLPKPSLVSACMVCRSWRKILDRILPKPKSLVERHDSILQALFEDGTSLEFLEWFEHHLKLPVWNHPHELWLLGSAAKGGHLHLLQRAFLKGCDMTPVWTCNYHPGVCIAAARHGHLEVLKWARARGCEWNEKTCAAAAEGGHIEVLKWARANGCNWDWETGAFAARGGEWDTFTCSNAARGGHLELLKWARENGCEWDCTTCDNARAGSHTEVLKWAQANGCPEN